MTTSALGADMQTNPFALFAPFPEFSVWIVRKEDSVSDDAGAAAVLDADSFASVEQTHGNRTIVTHVPGSKQAPADGLITDTPGLTISVRWGDCQNFVVYAPERGVAGVLHAGWRGLVNGMIPEFFRVLQDEWGIDAGDTSVGAGPSLCMRCADFTDPTKELPADWAEFIDGRHVDLRAVADAQLQRAGVRGDRIERHADCTRCMPDTYWTWRGGHMEAMNKGMRNILACALSPR
jgi:copper oxidase (laccase) domain-containing protein